MCCVPDTTKCGSKTVSCGSDKFKDPAKAGTEAGATTQDQVANCCTEKATCASSSYFCPVGHKKKANSDSTKCTSDAATCASTCCERGKTKCGGLINGIGNGKVSCPADKVRGNEESPSGNTA